MQRERGVYNIKNYDKNLELTKTHMNYDKRGYKDLVNNSLIGRQKKKCLWISHLKRWAVPCPGLIGLCPQRGPVDKTGLLKRSM